MRSKWMYSYFLLSVCLRCVTVNSNEVMCTGDSPGIPKYYLLEKCHRSKLGILAREHFSSLTSCQRLGIEKRALALNFSPPEVNATGPLEHTCELLKCAEAEGGLSMSNDTNYDYYSIYGKPLPSLNSTCVPGAGMFRLVTSKLNHTQAQEVCRNQSSVLADVTSEQRTDSLAQLLIGSKVDNAYSGLWRGNASIYYNTNGDSLDCTTYRAWAPGHPKKHVNMSCVVLTRQRTWKTTLCNMTYPALCELIPGGPYVPRSIFTMRRNNDTEDPKALAVNGKVEPENN